MPEKTPAPKRKTDARRKVWYHKDYKGKTFYGAYRFIWNDKVDAHERLLVLIDAAVAKPKKKDTHYADSHEDAKRKGWKVKN